MACRHDVVWLLQTEVLLLARWNELLPKWVWKLKHLEPSSRAWLKKSEYLGHPWALALSSSCCNPYGGQWCGLAHILRLPSHISEFSTFPPTSLMITYWISLLAVMYLEKHSFQLVVGLKTKESWLLECNLKLWCKIGLHLEPRDVFLSKLSLAGLPG